MAKEILESALHAFSMFILVVNISFALRQANNISVPFGSRILKQVPAVSSMAANCVLVYTGSKKSTGRPSQ